MAERFDLPDMLPEPDPGRMEQPMEGWVPLRPDLPFHGLRLLMDVVAHITYKPGYRLRVDDPGMGGRVLLVIVARMRNTYRPADPPNELAMRFEVQPWLLERWGEWASWDQAGVGRARRDILRWVRKCLGHHELHERDEWFRVDGVMVFDPHEKVGPTGLRLNHQ